MVADAQRVYGRRRPASDRNAMSITFMACQTRFPPVRRTAKAKRSAWSAPSKQQQTITQMNPFRAIYHPEEDEENLQYLDDETGAYQEPPKRVKRRKMSEDDTPTQPLRTILTRNKTSKILGGPIKALPTENKSLNLDPAEQHNDNHVSKMMPPPPKTPISKKTVKTEIPSSQSPVWSPLSARSSRDREMREFAIRSPFKERSTNVRMRRHSAVKEPGDSFPVKEIVDSMENEGESIESVSRSRDSPLRTQTAAEKLCKEPSTSQPSIRETPKTRFGRREAHIQLVSPEQHPSSCCPASSKAPKMLEILDSDADDESDDNVSTSYYKQETLRCRPNISNVTVLDNKAPLQPEAARSRNDSSMNLKGIPPQALLKSLRTPQPQPSIDVPSSQPELDICSPTKQPHPHRESPHQVPPEDPASTQLRHDVARSTHPNALATLITESQYEQGWKPYHLPSSSSALQPLSLPPSPDTENHHRYHHHHQTPKPMPTQPLPATTVSKTFVPPSQATTADTTQLSPPSQILSSSPILHASTPPPPPAPPLPPAFSSSPLMSRRGMSQVRERKGYAWDGRGLTDSQLLPASLMEDSFGGMPNGLLEDEDEEEL